MSNVINFQERLLAKRDEEFEKRQVLNSAEVQAAIDDAMLQVVAKVRGRDVTRGELREVFDLVCDPENWKMPIHRTLNYSGSDKDDLTLELIVEAVAFFTGSVATLRWGRDEVTITAPGYYNTIGA